MLPLQGDAASRDPFFDLGGFSDDEDEGQGGRGFANRFKIVIKSKEVRHHSGRQGCRTAIL